MKTDIHPTYYPGSQSDLRLRRGRLDYRLDERGDPRRGLQQLPPLWTGEQRIVDTEGRVERLMRRYGMSMEE